LFFLTSKTLNRTSLYAETCRLLWYKEPTPEPVGDLESHLLGRVVILHKQTPEPHLTISKTLQAAVVRGAKP
jgi:hypothetical protein